MTTTPNLGMTLPVPNVDTGWGFTLNDDLSIVDDIFAANGSGTSVGINVGTGKTAVLSGTIIIGSGSGTGSAAGNTLQGADKTGTNAVGPNVVIRSGNGTGSGGSGSVIFQTAPGSTAGITANTMRDVLTIDAAGNITANVGSFISSTGVPLSSAVSGINTQTGTAYTLVLADAGKLIEMNNAAANTLTVPPNSSVAFPVGTIINVTATGVGQTTLVAGSGVTLRAYGGKLKLTGQFSQAALIKRGTDTWAVAGDLIL